MIELRRLTIGFPADGNTPEIAVRELSLAVAQGERVGIVGESGSGKSLTALACLGLVPEPGRILGGAVLIEGQDLGAVPAATLQRWRGGDVGITFQEASGALNPVYTIGFQLQEAIHAHRTADRIEVRALARKMLEMVALDCPERILGAYPHQLSGGQAQRVMLAMALAGRPRLLIADEPTSSLDLVTRVEILGLVDRLIEEAGLGLLLISHDLELVRGVVDRVAVMYSGEIVEEAPTDLLFRDPLHPYTRRLLAATLDDHRQTTQTTAPQVRQLPASNPQCCQFASRCSLKRDSCVQARPKLVRVAADRKVRCPVTAGAVENSCVEH